MPIALAQPILQTNIQLLLSKGKSANQNDFARNFTNALSAVVPMGMFPVAPVPVPMSPSGKSLCENTIRQSLSLKQGATSDTVSMLFATGVSFLVPIVPPVGLMNLKNQIKKALDMGTASNKQVFSLIVSAAIVQYYTSGGVL